MNIFLLFAILSTSLFAASPCEERPNLPQTEVFSWFQEVTGEKDRALSKHYFLGKRPGELSTSELARILVGFYTADYYEEINQALRNGVGSDTTFMLAEGIDKALCDFSPYAGKVYRGADLPQSAVDEYVEDAVIDMRSFTSTSKSKKVGCDFALNVLYEIQSKTGRDIEDASLKKFEKEVLFRKDTSFRVTGVETDKKVIKRDTDCSRKDMVLIKMEEI